MRLFDRSASFYILVAFLFLCLVGGGSSYLDTWSLLFVRPAAVIALFAFLMLPGRLDLAFIRVPLILLICFAALFVLQLIPLPPDLWLSLPGREHYAEAAAVAGLEQPWRPLSLTPDLTLSGLISLIVPAAVLIGVAKLSAEERGALLPVLIALCCASAAFGVLQVAMGRGSAAYYYIRMHEGVPTGFLANRNHQAVLLAIALPLLAIWSRGGEQRDSRWRFWVAGVLGVLLIFTIFATGSRAGMAAMLIAAIAATFLFSSPGRSRGGSGRWTWALRLGVPAVLIAVAVVSLQFGRAVSIDRLMGAEQTVEEDARFEYYPQTWEIGKEFFPWGTGIGSFKPVYVNFELDTLMTDLVVNQAHNDLLDLFMTAGLPGLLLLLAFLAWLALSGWRAFSGRARPGQHVPLARAAFAAIAIVLLASLVDYPLRTPLVGAVFALLCGWLCFAEPAGPRRARHEPDDGAVPRSSTSAPVEGGAQLNGSRPGRGARTHRSA